MRSTKITFSSQAIGYAKFTSIWRQRPEPVRDATAASLQPTKPDRRCCSANAFELRHEVLLLLFRQMGCVQGKEGGGGGSSGGSNTLSWNEQYERARQSKNDTLVRMNSNGRSLRHTRGPVKANEPPERRESFVEKQGGQLTSVNGYDIKGPLGKGAFGEVFLALKDGDKYAIKVLHKQVLKRQRQGRTGSAFDSVKTEIATMRKVCGLRMHAPPWPFLRACDSRSLHPLH